MAAAVVKWCDSPEGEANLCVLECLTAEQVHEAVSTMKTVWENRGKKITDFREFVEPRLRVRLPVGYTKGRLLASYQSACTCVLNLGEEE